jgi:aryl-alcohol dehydrogenase-like predicted oxidoreductase
MSDIIESGRAHYWGTSEWTADEVRTAWEIAERHHLRKPVMEQPQYNLFHRARVEQEYRRLYDDIGLGLTVWSPLASGLLSGKYLDGIPDDSRATLPGYEWLRGYLSDDDRNAKVRSLKAIADELGCTLSQLSLAWCASNRRVSSVITGASRVEQVQENLGALDVLPKLDRGLKTRIDEAMGWIGLDM